MSAGHLVGLQGRLARPYWGLMAGWAALCGALSSNYLRWDRQSLLTLALVLILTELAWGSLWDLATGTDWFRLLRVDWSPTDLRIPPALPYTLPASPGGRLAQRAHRFAGWWRKVFWPAAGSAWLGLVAAMALTIVMSLLLPSRLNLLNAAFVASVGVGIAWRKQGKEPLAVQSVVQVGLSWLAGHLIFAEMELTSLLLALGFVVGAWGISRATKGLWGAAWLLNGGLVATMAVVTSLNQPLAAGIVGLLYFGALAVQLVLSQSGVAGRSRLYNRIGPWLMAIMLVAALIVP